MANFDVRECSANIQRLPDNHEALLATFPPNEQMKVIELLKLHQDYLSADLLLAMDTNDSDKILKGLLSSLTTKQISFPTLLFARKITGRD